MKKTTTDLTIEYIKQHYDIQKCLQKGLINYSALSRRIRKELGIEKKTSMEAILVAARRYQEKLKKNIEQEKKIMQLLQNSQLQIRNKIVAIILEKNIDLQFVQELQKRIKQDSGVFYLIEGSEIYTIIVEEKNASGFVHRYENKIVKQHRNLALLTFVSSKEIEDTMGVLAYLTTLFSENGINILECISCWRDTLFIINAKDTSKAIEFLHRVTNTCES